MGTFRRNGIPNRSVIALTPCSSVALGGFSSLRLHHRRQAAGSFLTNQLVGVTESFINNFHLAECRRRGNRTSVAFGGFHNWALFAALFVSKYRPVRFLFPCDARSFIGNPQLAFALHHPSCSEENSNGGLTAGVRLCKCVSPASSAVRR
jgi:hypothetical protein